MKVPRWFEFAYVHDLEKAVSGKKGIKTELLTIIVDLIDKTGRSHISLGSPSFG